MVDLVRDSRWGRVMESIGGEDPYLGQVFAKAIVQAHKETNNFENDGIISCVKHFAAYGAVEAGRDYNTVDMSEREFRQYYLPAYKEAIDSGAEMIMTSFNIINGIPATINKWLLKDLLRKELDFNGIVISDYSAIEETIEHGVSKDKEDAAYRAITAGVDIDMMSDVYANNLKKLVEEKKISEKNLDEAVFRILKLKNNLGLFENPYRNLDNEIEEKTVLNKENRDKARILATKTFVLLKNNNVLPLNKKQKIALIGPYADNIAILGSWSMFSDREKITTLREAFENKIGKENVIYAKGSEILEEREINQILQADGGNTIHIENEKEKLEEYIKEAIKVSEQADIIVLGIGEHYRQSGEACSRANIEISDIQKKLLKELSRLDKRIVAILFNGRPIVLKEIEENVDALLEVWFPGTEGANAITDIIFGDINPSGKLTMSFPQATGQCPIYYNHYNTGRPHKTNIRYVSRYQDIPTESLYPFGYGLSYSKFLYSNLKLSSKILTCNSKIIVSVKVKNASNIKGEEVVQLYIQDLVARVVRPVKELKAFKKIELLPNEGKDVFFSIKEEMLRFWNENSEFSSEDGDFRVFVGTSSEDVLTDIFTLKK